MLLGFQRKNVLDSDSSAQDTEDDDVKVIKKIKSKNNYVKIMTLGKIKKLLETYFKEESKMKEVDKRLIHGVIDKVQMHQKNSGKLTADKLPGLISSLTFGLASQFDESSPVGTATMLSPTL